MIWLLTEILVFVLAAAVFGGLIGLGLAGGVRRASMSSGERQQLLEQLQQTHRAQRAIEGKAKAVAAAEAAARGDLERRLVDAEGSLAETRDRAESAELRLRALQNPAEAPSLAPSAAGSPDAAADGDETERLRAAVKAAEMARRDAEATLLQAEEQREAALEAAARAKEEGRAMNALSAREIASLRAQLGEAEEMRAKSEAALTIVHARAQEAVRAASPKPHPVAPPLHPLMAAGAVASPPAAAAPPPALPGTAPAPAPPSAPMSAPAASPASAAASGGWGQFPLNDADKPAGLPAPRGGRPDDLRRIRGIGPKNEGVLNSLGIYHYEQIASLTSGNVAWLDAYLKFHGRIAREDWVGQAKALAFSRAQPHSGNSVVPDDASA